MFLNFKEAGSAAILAGLLILPIFGYRLFKDGDKMGLENHIGYVFFAVFAAFIVTLTRPMWGQMSRVLPRMNPFILDGAQQKKATIWFFVCAGFFPVFLVLLNWVWPSFDYRNYLVMSNMALTYIILGLGLNIVVGYAGLLNLGYVAFYAIGGYTFAYLFKYFQFTFWMSLPFAVIAAAFVGFLISLPLLRLRGDYLAIVTLAFAEILRQVLNKEAFGGPGGVSGMPQPTLFGIKIARRGTETFHKMLGIPYDGRHMEVYLYFIGFAFAVLTVFVCMRLLRMPLGRAWEALREDEIACQSLGINPAPVKIWAFTIGAAIAGMAGAYFGTRQTMVNPESFQFIESIMILAAVVLGGMGSNFGVILASILIIVLQEVGRGLQEYRMLIFGLLLVVMMIWRPQGLLPSKRSKVELSS